MKRKMPAEEQKPKPKNFHILVMVALITVFSLTLRSIVNLNESKQRLATAEQKMYQLEAEQQELIDQIAYANSDNFLEKAALEELNLTQDQKTILVMQTQKPIKQVKKEQLESQEKQLKNWQLWAKELNL